SSRDRDPLLHSTRQSVWIAACKLREIDFFDEYGSTLLGFAARKLSAGCESEHDVIFHRLPWQKLIEFLKYKNPLRAWRLDGFAVEKDRPFERLDIASDRSQDRGFSAA